MKIATHFEIENKADMLKRRIATGEQIATYCVQDSSCTYDIYNGTLKQCQKEAKRMKRDGEEVARIVLMTLDEGLCADFCLEEVEFE